MCLQNNTFVQRKFKKNYYSIHKNITISYKLVSIKICNQKNILFKLTLINTRLLHC